MTIKRLLLPTLLFSSWAAAQEPPTPGHSAPQSSKETTISGKLIDAQCHSEAKCRVDRNTKNFGLILKDGTYLAFDEGGNQKAVRFLTESKRGRKMLIAKPGSAKRMTVTASGTRTSDVFNLETLR